MGALVSCHEIWVYYQILIRALTDLEKFKAATHENRVKSQIEASWLKSPLIHCSFPVFSRIVLIISFPTLIASGNRGAK